MTSEFFKWKSLSIEQHDLVLKVGTDAILLGSWIKKIISNSLSILDAGTGSGVIAMMLSENFPAAKIIAIDTDENAVKLAENNFRYNSKDKGVISRCEDVLDTPSDEIKYDLIVSNPPYFFGQLHAAKQHNRNAKHTVHSHDEWIHGCAQRLAENGDVCLIVPYENASHWITSANNLRLYCQHRVDVNSFAGNTPVRSLLHFHQALVKPSLKSLTIYESINTYTTAYLELTGIQPEKRL
ncbi:MAG TPA: methyltransferase [Saprospiraceae bacterium]|nr:methyltransferase [Saprospiraceae bacterium]